MELKTQVQAAEGKQELWITREFELPVDLLFKAYTTASLLEQWMGTKVLKLESKPHGSFQFETTDPMGNVHSFHGTIHSFIPNQQMVRTFEMQNKGFGIQLETISFESLGANNSKLRIQVLYQSVALRDAHLKMPFRQGINWAHNALQEIANKPN
jgi:uncharacterized protein YndB with AHSA1/START domain